MSKIESTQARVQNVMTMLDNLDNLDSNHDLNGQKHIEMVAMDSSGTPSSHRKYTHRTEERQNDDGILRFGVLHNAQSVDVDRITTPQLNQFQLVASFSEQTMAISNPDSAKLSPLQSTLENELSPLDID